MSTLQDSKADGRRQGFTPAEVLQAYAVAARLVELHGDEFLPFFVAMEGEVARLQSAAAAGERARAVSRRAAEMGLAGKTRLGYRLGNPVGYQTAITQMKDAV